MLLQYAKRLERLHFFIRLKSTGTPKEFAHIMGISERSLYYYLLILKDKGATISYDRIRNSYYYLENIEFSLHFKKNKLFAC
jgi:transcriptional antiterminator